MTGRTSKLWGAAIVLSLAACAQPQHRGFSWISPAGGPSSAAGMFDGGALRDLAVAICPIDATGACRGPVERFTSSTATGIQLDGARRFYRLEWLAPAAGMPYRITVTRAGPPLASRIVEAAPGPLTLRFRLRLAVGAGSGVTINEVESNGGVPGDWVELFNSAAAPLSLAGYVVKDNDDTHAYTLPPDATIAANGYFLIEEAELGFGLGAADSVRLFDAAGALAETYSWTAHAASTYGRCPDAAGDFAVTTASTKGAANDCASPVKISEIESNGGTPGDWVELYNAGGAPVDISDYIFLDNDETHAVYKVPKGVILPPGGYYVLEEANFGFGLGADDTARIFDNYGVLGDSHSWTAHASTTYGRCPSGVGDFATTVESTKGAANNCPGAAVTSVRINEVESNGGTPGDWVEIINAGASTVDLSGWRVIDNDDAHVAYALPQGTRIAPGGYLLIEEADLGFGLGAADSVRLFDAAGALYESYSWTAHAATTYGRCPNGAGELTTTTSSTKGGANDCGNLVTINEIESNEGTPGDWVEIYNAGGTAADLSGYLFRDSDDARAYAIPQGTILAPGAYLVLEEAAFGFGLGAGDGARLFDPAGALVDSYAWTAHSATTYGRCPNGAGAFATTTGATKGAQNACPGAVTFLAWPGGADVQAVSGMNAFGGNLSGLMYEGSGTAAPGVMWAVRNGPETLFRLVWNGTIWTPDAANGWGAGKALRYANGLGAPDAEGVTFAANSAAGLYVSTERDNGVSGASRNSILRFDPAAAGAALSATHEWNLTADLPAVGANLGIEAITWIPDAFLVSSGFFDESRNRLYNPADYANHGAGLFFVGVEANGILYGYALDHSAGGGGGGFTRVATVATGFTGVMDIQFDRERNDLWAVCDDTCQGRSAVLRIDPASGKFAVERRLERPGQMPNVNNEGFAFAPLSECVNNLRPAFWADDSETAGLSIRRGGVSCAPF